MWPWCLLTAIKASTKSDSLFSHIARVFGGSLILPPILWSLYDHTWHYLSMAGFKHPTWFILFVFFSLSFYVKDKRYKIISGILIIKVLSI